LRTRAATVLGLIISDITNPFFTAVVRGAEDQTQLAGYRRLSAAPVDSVTVDNQLAPCKAAQHLLAQGCRRVGLVAGPVQTTTGASRLAGYRAALGAARRTVDPSLVAYADFRTEGGYAATRQLLHQRQPPDGLLFSNNLMAVGGLKAIAEAGLAIPDDIAIVGFDDAIWTTALRPPLTVVAQPTYEIGQTARSSCSAVSRGTNSRRVGWCCGGAHRAGKLTAHYRASLTGSST
jgi:DNA-binding LacI/PurR family transcriptional regulator